MTSKSPFEQFLGLVDAALDAVTEVVAANSDAPAGRRETDPVARAMKGVSLIFGDFLPPAPKAATKPTPDSTWGAATDDVTDSPDSPPASPAGFQPKTPDRLAELENLRTFCEQAATMLFANVETPMVFFLIANDVSAASPEFAEDVASIGTAIRQGRYVADAMDERGSFPPMLVEMVRAAQAGGHLPETFRKAGAYFRDEIEYLDGRPGQPAAGERR